MNKKIIIFISVALIAFISIICIFSISNNNKEEIQTIKSEKQLLEIYKGSSGSSDAQDIFTNLVAMPFSFWSNSYSRPYYRDMNSNLSANTISSSSKDLSSNITTMAKGATISDSTNMVEESSSSSSKDYSTTNIQVENVDEADITKTDGDFIYSISENKVIITNVKDPVNIKIESTITIGSTIIPEDLLLYKDKLVVIASNTSSNRNTGNTYVRIYDITDKSKPSNVKTYELNVPYYTSRCISNQLYVIGSGYLTKDGDKIDRSYTEDNNEKQIELENIKYLKDRESRIQTIFSVVDLDNVSNDIKVSSYLIDITNSYVSENNIYLLDQNYEYSNSNKRNSGVPPLSRLFGFGGIFGFFNYDYYYDDYYYDDTSSKSGYYTEIFKFNILNNGDISYDTKSKVKGKTINQYSLDEKNNHLRIALYDNEGARVVILDDRLEQIGETSKVAKGEQMYSSRFMDNKAYLVTYRNTDPLFVIDLSDEHNPKVLGELHIPGYSTYLHPYDDTHLIGIGMETEETVNRNSSGKVTTTSATIIGMKMALFDVSDVKNPVQISQTVIGDRRTTSAILTNPKALLFSKEKQLIAIPVNNYSEDFKVTSSSDEYSSIINSYKSYNKDYVAEGYFVYSINLTDGFKLKGVIKHEAGTKKSSYYSYYTKLLRGLYIDNNLYTVSETAVKVNKLDTLEQVSELKIK